MRRFSPLMPLAAALIAVAAACTADAPSAPPSAIGPSRAIANLTYPACDPSGIRSTMASLYNTTDLKSFALPTFNKAESLKQAGDLSGARTQYYSLVDHLLATLTGERLRDPSTSASIQANAFFVMASVLACAGEQPIDDLETLITGIGNHRGNYNICVVLAYSERASCAAPSGGAAVTLDANFLTREALIIVQPDFAELDEELFEEDLGTTWSDVWRLRIEPLSAQRNYGVASPPATDPKGHAAVCTVDKFDDFTHHQLTESALLRLGYRSDVTGDDAVILPGHESSIATLLLDCAEYSAVWDQDQGIPTVASLPLLDAWPARLALRALRGIGDQVGGVFTVTPLYAFDGGIGGSFFSSESYFSAVEKQVVYIRRDPSTVTQGPLSTLSLATQATFPVVGSRTAFGVVRDPDSCSWTSSHSRVRVTPLTTGSPYATLSTGNSAGEAVVTATCTYRDVTSVYATTVTVSRP